MEYGGLVLREVPQEERPRERMMKHGVSTLSHAELLAILLRTGTVQQSAVALAQRLLAEAGGLRGLAEWKMEQMTGLRGIGSAKAMQIQAGIELGRRVAASSRELTPSLRSPQDVADLLMEELRFLNQEHFIVLFLNTKNRLIGKETMSIGSLNATVVHPREVYRAAISRSAASIICAHNHPSGDPQPSREDVLLTRRLSEAGQLIGIDLLDHIVIGEHRFSSLKEQGYL